MVAAGCGVANVVVVVVAAAAAAGANAAGAACRRCLFWSGLSGLSPWMCINRCAG